MRKLVLFATSLYALLLSISVTPVQAQNALWVAASGSDAAVCSQAAPCATFQGAISKGSVTQINCLTSGSYGAFTVTASITIDCGAGNIGTVASLITSGIDLNIAAAATVVLRHLSLTGPGSGSTQGIHTTLFSGGSLILEDCSIQRFAAGISLSTSAGGRGLLELSNVQVLNGGTGIIVDASAGQIASVAFNRVEVVGNASTGILFSGSGVVAGTMTDGVVAGSGGTGVLTASSQVYFTVDGSSIIANLTNGIQTLTAGSVVNVGGSTIGGNGTGVKATAGQLISFGNNQMSANGTNGSFTSTTPLK